MCSGPMRAVARAILIRRPIQEDCVVAGELFRACIAIVARFHEKDLCILMILNDQGIKIIFI